MFDSSTVETQLRATGVLETVAISKQLCPVKLSFDEFLHRYDFLVKSESKDQLKEPQDLSAKQEMPDVIQGIHVASKGIAATNAGKKKKRRRTYEGIKMPNRKASVNSQPLNAVNGIQKWNNSTSISSVSSSSMNSNSTTSVHSKQTPKLFQESEPIVNQKRATVQNVMDAVFNNNDNNNRVFPKKVEAKFMLGKSKIFLSEHQFQILEAQRERKLEMMACVIQRVWRRYRLECQEDAAITIQASVRGFLQRKRFRLAKLAVEKIQSIFRGKLIRRNMVRQREAALTIIRFFMCVKERKEFLRKRSAAVVIQDAFRMWKMRKLEAQLKNKRKRDYEFGGRRKSNSEKLRMPVGSKGQSWLSAEHTPTRGRSTLMSEQSFSSDDSMVTAGDLTLTPNYSLYLTPDAGGGGDGPKASVEAFDTPLLNTPFVNKCRRRREKNRQGPGPSGDTAGSEQIDGSIVSGSISMSSTLTSDSTFQQSYPDLLIDSQLAETLKGRLDINSHRSQSLLYSPIRQSPSMNQSAKQSPSPRILTNQNKHLKLTNPNSSSLNDSQFSGISNRILSSNSNDMDMRWRFQPFEALQRREKRRGSIIFNQTGGIKELTQVPYIEISARGDIVSRRRLTRVPIRFHLNKGDILPNAHVLPWQEMISSITDCLPDYDHIYCNPQHCSSEHVKTKNDMTMDQSNYIG